MAESRPLSLLQLGPALRRGHPQAESSTFSEAVLRAYAYQCAMCGFDGKPGRNPVRALTRQ
jgi:hypothetical protein